MAKIFPGGRDRIPDLVNLKIIRKEVRNLEDLVINARQNGQREVVTDQTTFTDPNVAAAQSPSNEVVGTADHPDMNSTDIVSPDSTLQLNDKTVIFDNGATLQDVVDQINAVDSIDVEASIDGSGPYNLKLATNLNSGRIAIQSGSGTTISDLGLSVETTYYIDLTANTITLIGHGYSTGDQVQVQSDNQLPTPLNSFPDSLYYVIDVDSNTLQLATTEQRAQDGVAIDLTQYGEGTFSIQKTLESEIYFEIWQNYLEDRVRQQHMNEVISYFKENDYMIFRTINQNTDSTFKWNIKW